jgi:hypothetical protein
MEDENLYEAIDGDITRSMLSAAKQCNLRKMHTEPWSPAIGLATHAIRYWDVRIKHKGDRNPMSGVLNYYLSLSDVEADAHDKPLSMEECIKQINQARQKLKDVVANAKEHRTSSRWNWQLRLWNTSTHICATGMSMIRWTKIIWLQKC